jgi:hypothetical protein
MQQNFDETNWYIGGEEFSFCMSWFCLLHTRSRESMENPIVSRARYVVIFPICFHMWLYLCYTIISSCLAISKYIIMNSLFLVLQGMHLIVRNIFCF